MYKKIFYQGKYYSFHRWIWEKHYGKIPSGYEIHHKNGDKLDNRIVNLECLTRGDHVKKHNKFILKDGVWFKLCRGCDLYQEFELCFSKDGNKRRSRCRKCRTKENKIYRLLLNRSH